MRVLQFAVLFFCPKTELGYDHGDIKHPRLQCFLKQPQAVSLLLVVCGTRKNRCQSCHLSPWSFLVPCPHKLSGTICPPELSGTICPLQFLGTTLDHLSHKHFPDAMSLQTFRYHLPLEFSGTICSLRFPTRSFPALPLTRPHHHTIIQSYHHTSITAYLGTMLLPLFLLHLLL